MVEESKNREFCWEFLNKGFGKRPSILLNENDILELAKKGAVSFHVSVERWSNPLLLRKDMKNEEMDELRIGWDLLIDIDSPNLEISRILADLIVKAIEDHGVSDLGIKYSGNKGFHIVVPFESFPSEIDGKDIRKMFPEMARIVSEYLFNYVKEKFEEKILDNWEISEIKRMTGKDYKELLVNGKLNVNAIAEIDSMVMSKRHLFRLVYSLNPKSWLVSIPIKSVKKFEKEMANPDYVEGDLRFLPKGRQDEAAYLFEISYEWYNLKKMETLVEKGKNIPKISIKGKIPEDFFPPCIKNILLGLEDGRKRSLFILMNFLGKIGWDKDDIERLIWEWNERNKPPLKESYIRSQMKWFRKRENLYIPPNCDNDKYYKDIGVCEPDDLCSKVKNPLTYVFRRYREWLRRQPRGRSRRS